MPIGEGVRGIADAKVALLTGDTPGTNTDITGIKTLTAEITSDSDEQTGDDTVLMTVQENQALDVTIGSAYANLAALGVFTGYTPIASGTTPNVITTWKHPAAANTAYVQVTGQARGRDANNSALRATLLKLQLTGGPDWDFSEGAWLEPELNLTGVGRGEPAYLYEISSWETLTPLT